MIRSLWTAATGMSAQQFNLDTISNNIANVNTIGFKKNRADFEDLLYSTLRLPGTPIATGSVIPTGTQVGHGVFIAGSQKLYSMGSVENTGNDLDLAIEGDGFFQVLLPDGSSGYTRAGSFKMDAEGKMVTVDGYVLQPEITIPQDATDISIGENGTVSVVIGDNMASIEEVGKIELVRFINPAGLKAEGRNYLTQTAASGEPITGEAGTGGVGSLRQGFIEMSNVDIVEEMIGMIIAQRAYEMNSKAIQTADTMLGVASSLKRA